MLYTILNIHQYKGITMLSIILVFLITVLSLKYFSKYLPHDKGREFAVNGELSRGKPRGAGIMLLLDGGIGLIKVSLLRFLKIRILKTVKTPIYDFVRKDKGWSDSQVVFRFVTIQVLISFLLLYSIFVV